MGVAFGAQKRGQRSAVIFEQQVTTFAEVPERTRRLPHRGEIVCAVVAPRGGSAVREAEIVRLCREHFAGFTKPGRVLIANELPKNASGRVLKRQLRARWSLASSSR